MLRCYYFRCRPDFVKILRRYNRIAVASYTRLKLTCLVRLLGHEGARITSTHILFANLKCVWHSGSKAASVNPARILGAPFFSEEACSLAVCFLSPLLTHHFPEWNCSGYHLRHWLLPVLLLLFALRMLNLVTLRAGLVAAYLISHE